LNLLISFSQFNLQQLFQNKTPNKAYIPKGKNVQICSAMKFPVRNRITSVPTVFMVDLVEMTPLNLSLAFWCRETCAKEIRALLGLSGP
jgi:hypothetical protein